eukprot:12426395-Karenia_brevis.AAC.1
MVSLAGRGHRENTQKKNIRDVTHDVDTCGHLNRSAGPFRSPVGTCVPSPRSGGMLPKPIDTCVHVILALMLDVTLEYQSNCWMLTKSLCH